MGSLVIVESPAKARTINKILGKQFTVKASVGHVKDLPKKSLGVDVDNGFKSEYGIIPGKEKVVKELKAAAKKADRIYLAPDPDREGEAIAYHIKTEIAGGKDDSKIFRVTFNEITAKAVKEAMANPGKIDQDKVDAQQARRVLDRLVGYNLSPLLWKKVRRGLSAGRVQSVAVRLVVDREREVQAFTTQEYWSVPGRFKGPLPPEFEAKLQRYGNEIVIKRDEDGGKFLITSAEDASRIAAEASEGLFTVTAVEKKQRKRSPAAPFTTSTLQQEAARKLGFTAKRAMMVAQQLYEGVELGAAGAVGLITYMRTDSVRVSAEAQSDARDYITREFGPQYIPAKPPVYKSKASAQEAHEAIRPTGMERPPEALRGVLSKDQFKLYELVWKRFLASQMKPAEMEQTAVDITGGKGGHALFRATGRVIKFHGFMALYTESIEETASDDEDSAVLPPLKEGEKLELLGLSPQQHFTQPPPRFTEASLVKTLEENGIGRPSTYASILSTIVERKYTDKNEGRFFPTELGMVVNDYLVDTFPELLDVDFTAKMETDLDHIEEGKSKWEKVIKEFYKPFSRDLKKAEKDKGKVKPEDIATEETCDKCGKPMIIRWGRHGRFMACSGYPECKNTRPLEGDTSPRAAEEPTDEKCPACGTAMVIKSGRFGRFLACSNYPDCKTTKPIPTGAKCPEDGGDIVERRTRKGKSFWSCANYPKCKFASWHPLVNEPCPQCKAAFLTRRRDRQGAEFMACAQKSCGYRKDISEGK